jgi:hypothetical protein
MWHFMFQMSKVIVHVPGTGTTFCVHMSKVKTHSRACMCFNVQCRVHTVWYVVHTYVLIYLRFTPHTCIQRFLHSSYNI